MPLDTSSDYTRFRKTVNPKNRYDCKICVFFEAPVSHICDDQGFSVENEPLRVDKVKPNATNGSLPRCSSFFGNERNGENHVKSTLLSDSGRLSRRLDFHDLATLSQKIKSARFGDSPKVAKVAPKLSECCYQPIPKVNRSRCCRSGCDCPVPRPNIASVVSDWDFAPLKCEVFAFGVTTHFFRAIGKARGKPMCVKQMDYSG